MARQNRSAWKHRRMQAPSVRSPALLAAWRGSAAWAAALPPWLTTPAKAGIPGRKSSAHIHCQGCPVPQVTGVLADLVKIPSDVGKIPERLQPMPRGVRVAQGVVVDIRIPVQRLRVPRLRHQGVRLQEATERGIIKAGLVIVEAQPRLPPLAGEAAVGGPDPALRQNIP